MNIIRKYGLVALIILGMSTLATAQNNPLPDFKRHEVGISTGAFSQPSYFFILSQAFPYHYEGYKSENFDYRMYNIGSFSLSYRYHFTPRQSLGVVTTLFFSKIEDKDKVRDLSGTFTYWSFQPQYRVTYKHFDHCALYFSVAFGVTMRIASSGVLSYWDSYREGYSLDYGRLHFAPASHITFLGISLGNDNNANFELGFGTQGVLNVGYSRKF